VDPAKKDSDVVIPLEDVFVRFVHGLQWMWSVHSVGKRQKPRRLEVKRWQTGRIFDHYDGKKSLSAKRTRKSLRVTYPGALRLGSMLSIIIQAVLIQMQSTTTTQLCMSARDTLLSSVKLLAGNAFGASTQRS
jgi:hypothetical protein